MKYTEVRQSEPVSRHWAFNMVFAAVVFAAITLLLPHIHTFSGDDSCWKSWSAYMLKNGLSEAYGSGTNYLPLYQYVLWGFGKLAGTEAAIAERLPYLRCVTLLFDFAGIWMLWQWLDKKISYPILLLSCLVNLAFSYNTIFWGQVDGIEAALVFAAIYAAYKQRVLISGVALVLALNMKLQAVVFVPIWAILIVGVCATSAGRKQALLTAISMIGLQLLIIWPFAYGPGGWTGVWEVITGSLHNVPKISVNAYNWWYWATTEYPGGVSDEIVTRVGMTYKQIGLVSFFSLAVLAIWPLMATALTHIRNKARFTAEDRKCVWLTCALVCLLFFFCNTEMHERYVHPAVLFMTAYAFGYNRWLLYSIFSIAYLLNLEGAMHWLDLPNYGTLMFDGKMIAGLYAIVIVWLFVLLYRKGSTTSLADQGGNRGPAVQRR